MSTEKKLSPRLVLRENHPTMLKVMKLWDLAEELGIHIGFHGQVTTVEDRDRDSNLPMLRMEDIESQDGPQEFPAACEFKLVYDNPEYLAEQKREFEARRAADKLKVQEAENKRKAKEAEEKARWAQEKKEKELTLLAELKAKYENG